jgi:hypothetical protein
MDLAHTAPRIKSRRASPNHHHRGIDTLSDDNTMLTAIHRLSQACYSACAVPANQIEITLPETAYDLLAYDLRNAPGIAQQKDSKHDPSMQVYGVRVWRRESFNT